MAFMEPEMTIKLDWLELDTNYGLTWLPADVPNCSLEDALACLDNEDEATIRELLQYTEGTELHEIRVLRGYGVRLSAPGYLDCTHWDVFTNKREAERAYRELEREANDDDC